MAFGRWGFGEMNGTVALTKETPEDSLAPYAM